MTIDWQTSDGIGDRAAAERPTCDEVHRATGRSLTPHVERLVHVGVASVEEVNRAGKVARPRVPRLHCYFHPADGEDRPLTDSQHAIGQTFITTAHVCMHATRRRWRY